VVLPFPPGYHDRVRRPVLHQLASRVGEAQGLDGPVGAVSGVASKVLKPGRVKDVLSGTFLGHPLHPLLTDLPIGTWMSALLLDLTGGRRSEDAARRLIGAGILAALPTAASGVSDWADTTRSNPPAGRVGLVHASANVTALTLFTLSYLRRRSGGSGRAPALAGAGALMVGGHLGGHLAYEEAVGVAQTTFERPPEDWVDAIADAAVTEGAMACVEVGDVPVMVTRREGRLYALSNRCSHRGGPLHQGALEDGCVTCPWHGSRFRLADGSVERGPASSPQPVYETRVREGRIELRSVRSS
jgi:nitrite reductase/ring-hydroxylating ferredoxin subunit/uncharacterized membrane protein